MMLGSVDQALTASLIPKKGPGREGDPGGARRRKYVQQALISDAGDA